MVSVDNSRVKAEYSVILLLMILSVSVSNGLVAQTYGKIQNINQIVASSLTAEAPKVILQSGNAGTSIIYANSTSAKVSVTAPAPIPTYYPNSYNISTGTYVSGSVPTSIQSVDTNYFIVRSSASATSTLTYNPSGYSLLGGTTYVSGLVSDLTSNNGVCISFRSYQSSTSAQTLYAHQETSTIGGFSYYQKKLTSADTAGISLSASMAATGRQLWGKLVYPFTGAGSIPASTWTCYYMAWRDNPPAIAFDVQSSSVQTTASTSISWSHTTATGSNRLLLVAVSVHVATGTPTTVSSVTYDGVPLTQVTTALYSATNPQVRTYVFQLVNPTSGTKTITVNFAAATLSVAGAATYTGVDQATPIQTSTTATGSGTAPSASVTVSGSGRWLFGHLGGHRTASPKAWTITEGPGQNKRWEQIGQDYKGVGSDKAVSAGLQSMSWTLSRTASYVASAVVINPAIPIGHADVDILIRRSDGTIRTTIATNVANSGDLSSTASTLSGTYSWATYIVVDQTDYLEIDYYVEVATAASGITAYLRIDDNTLALTDQTRTTNIMLPSEYTVELEFTGSSSTNSSTQLVWTVDSAWTAGSVSVTLQLYNYDLSKYPDSGDGYISYTSSATADTDETQSQTITTNSNSFHDASGNWKVKVKGIKATTSQFDFKADWIEFKPTYTEYTVCTEFLFSSMTSNAATQLNITVVSQYDMGSVKTTIQAWNYSSHSYVTSGEGYLTYISTGANETELLSINTNPQYYASTGSAKIKITGVLTTATQYEQRINQVELNYRYSSSSTYDYVLKVVNQAINVWEVRLKIYDNSNVERLTNATISFHDGSSSGQIIISGGNIIQSEGTLYSLLSYTTVYISFNNLQASTSERSNLYVYLEILFPNTSTYSLFTVTFEIT